MSRLEMLSDQLREVENELQNVCEQRIIASLTHPLAEKQRELVSRRKSIKDELRKLGPNVLMFSRRAVPA